MWIETELKSPTTPQTCGFERLIRKKKIGEQLQNVEFQLMMILDTKTHGQNLVSMISPVDFRTYRWRKKVGVSENGVYTYPKNPHHNMGVESLIEQTQISHQLGEVYPRNSMTSHNKTIDIRCFMVQAPFFTIFCGQFP